MKKRTLSLLMTLAMILSLLPMTALAAGPVNKAAPVISDLAVFYSNEMNEAGVEFTMTLTDENKALLAEYDEIGYPIYLMGDISVDGGEWQALECMELFYSRDYWAKDGQRVRTLTSADISAERSIKYRVYFFAMHPDGEWTGGYSNVLTLNEKIEFEASPWAIAELAKAEELGLIPDALIGQDLTKPITRAEFAAVSVKTYEAIAGVKAADPTVENPFKDTTDKEVLKAYEIGITTGTGDGTTFSPNDLLNREQAATMLTRVYKKTSMDGWTMAKDGEFVLEYTKPAPFSDDANISGWAKDSVYFMAANKIIQGSEGKFMPKATTDAEIAIGYAQATREQALLIAVRMVENLK